MATTFSGRAHEEAREPVGATIWTWLALAVALAGTAGSVLLTLLLDLIPCPLCYYQQTFIMAAFGVLALGVLTGPRYAAIVSLLALPASLAGLSVAAYHVLREAQRVMECPPGLLDLGSAPQQSLGLFLALTVLLAIDVLVQLAPRRAGLPALAGTLVLGSLLAASSLMSARPPDIPKDGPLVGCRKPAERTAPLAG